VSGGGNGAEKLYSCSSSIGTVGGRSWVAMSRPVAGAADSRVAIEAAQRLSGVR
jgi:hypothetical protein